MMKILISGFIILVLSGCATNNIPLQAVKLPHYNKDKANVYFINNETVLGFDMEYLVEFYSANNNENISACYNQYSYNELDEGIYTISLKPYKKNHMFGSRDDHKSLNLYLKKGETYILKPDPTNDFTSIIKFLFTDWRTGQSLSDPQLKLKVIDYAEGTIEIDKIKRFKGMFGNRVYPARADEKSCGEYIANQIRGWF